MYALISPQEPIETGYRIAQIIDISHPVAEPLFWTLCSDTITSDKYFYNPTTQLRLNILSSGEIDIALYGYLAIGVLKGGAGVRRFNLA